MKNLPSMLMGTLVLGVAAFIAYRVYQGVINRATGTALPPMPSGQTTQLVRQEVPPAAWSPVAGLAGVPHPMWERHRTGVYY